VDADLDGIRKIFEINIVSLRVAYVQLAYRAWMTFAIDHQPASVGGLRPRRITQWCVPGGGHPAHRELAWRLGPAIRVSAVAPAVVDQVRGRALRGARTRSARRTR
jgi:hypothetical protein